MGNGEKTELLGILDFAKSSKSSESSPPNSYPFKRTMFMRPSLDGGRGGGSGGGVTGSVDDIYEAALSSWPVQPFNTCTRATFTASQLQELQRQTIICKYIMASMPVPPQLLLPLSNKPSPVHLPQSNTSGLDLKFGSGSDPEPWRCKRTDGKKWRCSRDVARDHKYCERHAHKSKPRSRKLVEVNSNNNTCTRNHQAPRNRQQTFQSPAIQFSAPSCDQTRYNEWLGKGDRGVITGNQQNMQQFLQTSTSRMGGFDNDQIDHSTPTFQMQEAAKVYPMNLNQYELNSTLENPLKNEVCNDSTTRDFIDAWSKDGGLGDGINNNGNGSFTSLTLSMSGLDSERSNEVLRSQWVSPVSWMSGGPLGEALCLGNASILPSPHGYSNSTSFGSRDNGSHGLDFIG